MSEARTTKILHVDDDEANRYAVTRVLVKAGFQVVEAADGAGALRAAAAERPDLAILDVRLPDIDGFEVCRRLKADATTADIPVLHLSASFVRSQDKAHGLDGGAEAYLVRPVEPVELLATVNALLRTRRTEEQLRQRERELVAQSERLNAALAASNTGTFRYDFVNQTFEEFDANLRRLFELDADTPATWQTALDRIDPEDLAAIRQRVRGCPDGADCEVEFRIRPRDGGRVRWLFHRGRILRDAAGEPRHLVGACTDVTALKEVEAAVRRAAEERERLLVREQAAREAAERARADAERARADAEHAREDAEHAGRMKDEFLATLSHELRTPLSAILGWSQVLARGEPKPAVLAEGLRTIERNARAQTQIIEDLLDMSRIISGKISLDPQRIDLSAVVRAAIETVRPAASAKGVEVTFDEPETRRPVLGDMNRLQQVFWNLLSNAIKFTPRGGTVRVRIGQRQSQWQADVIDTGEGIGEEFLPYVFDRFRQADASTTRKHGGLGLGLAIVKQVVELHGGRARVSSEGRGKGSTFTVSLPVSALQSEVGDAAPAAPRPLAAAAPVREGVRWDPSICDDLRGVTAVVLDDEADARALLRHLLEDCGATVHVAATVDEAIATVERVRPDVLVSDVGMPGEDGYAFLHRVRGLGPDRGGAVPAIALTAYARADDRVRAIRAGFQMHVPKPVEPAELVTMVSSLAKRSGR